MAQGNVGGGRRQQPGQNPRQPQRRQQSQRPQQPPRPRPQPPIRFRPPPVRNSPPLLSGVIGAIGVGFLVLVFVLAGGVPHGGGSKGHPGKAAPHAAPGPLPSVSIKGSIPCTVSPYNNLTVDRLPTCVSAKKYAKAKLALKYHGATLTLQFNCLDNLWTNESAWSAWSHNTTFTKDPGQQAEGIPQLIPAIHGHPFDFGEWQKQVDWGLDSYISPKYHTPCAAWDWWQHPRTAPFDRHWY